MDLIFATHNHNKVFEIQQQLSNKFNIQSLSSLGYSKEIPEPYETLLENAQNKANIISKEFNKICFSDDTGLFVPALEGSPGVYSARYAGPKATAQDNIEKLLLELKDKKDRSAYFKTIIVLKTQERTHFFEGTVQGEISKAPQGTGGFGYDPVFIPQDYSQSFAALPLAVKQKIGHRGKAVWALTRFLEANYSELK